MTTSDATPESPYERALNALSLRFESTDIGQRVRRVDLGKDDSLIFEIEHSGQRQWLRFTGGDLESIRPEADKRVPLAADLHLPDKRLIAWRPGRRIVLEDRSGPIARIEKGYRTRRFDAARRSHDAARALNGTHAFQTARLLDVDTSRAALVFELREGLEPRLRSEDASDFERVGIALRALQDANPLPSLPVHDAYAELQMVRQRLDRTRRVLGPKLIQCGQTLSRLDALASTLNAPLCPCHRDLHDGQLLFDEDRPTLLDFDLLCSADPALDPANLLAHLALRRLQDVRDADPNGVGDCCASLLEGLQRSSDRGFWTRLRFYESTAFLRLSALYAIRPRWTHLAPKLAELGLKCLCDAEEFVNQ